MYKLPNELLLKIYEFDSTYYEKYRDVLVIEYMPSLFQINKSNFDTYFKVPKEELYKELIK